MLALLVGAGVCAVVLVLGLVLAVVYAVQPGRSSGHGSGRPESSLVGDDGARESGRGLDPREVLAVKPMARVDEDASHPGPVTTADPGAPILLPAATATGQAAVPTGFPRTPAGALAQLAAIDQVAMQSVSLDTSRQVIRTWAAAGGPSASNWSVIQGLAELFGRAGVSSGASNQISLALTPLMGQIKGAIGPDFVVPCVDFELDITVAQTARGATADCQRMVWTADPTLPTKGRWVIGAGAEPATPPSVWPDTDVAFEVGYHDLRKEG